VRYGKGDKERRVQLHKEARRALRLWRDVRPASASVNLFGVSKRTLQRNVEQLGAQIGVPDLTCHWLRYTFAKRLEKNNTPIEAIRDLLDRRDFFVIPMINVDGAEFDIASGSYKMWRKNRSSPAARCAGVDLNRNYGFKWGTGGSSTDACSDIYMGPKAFSEPETVAVKNFVETHPNLKVLLTLHSYSELVLYPWGYTNDPILLPENQQGIIAVTVPAGVSYRKIRLTALTPGVIFYGLKTNEFQPFEADWHFDHSVLPPVE
jgi:hypothetical protein